MGNLQIFLDWNNCMREAFLQLILHKELNINILQRWFLQSSANV